jgi:hypothetical protein
MQGVMSKDLASQAKWEDVDMGSNMNVRALNPYNRTDVYAGYKVVKPKARVFDDNPDYQGPSALC